MEPAERPGDAHLQAQMVAYQAGRVEAFDALYAALAPELRAYLLGLCRDAGRADDLVQETFLRLHRARATYQPGLPVRPWARGIARRVFLMARRSALRRSRHEATVAAEASPASAAARPPGGERTSLARALAGVPAEARRPFLLHHLFGFSFAEIAARLGIEIGAAKVRSSRARLRLRAILNGGGGDAD
jgi:RNA polymerase sigma-70 factor (ECF subfamily)